MKVKQLGRQPQKGECTMTAKQNQWERTRSVERLEKSTIAYRTRIAVHRQLGSAALSLLWGNDGVLDEVHSIAAATEDAVYPHGVTVKQHKEIVSKVRSEWTECANNVVRVVQRQFRHALPTDTRK